MAVEFELKSEGLDQLSGNVKNTAQVVGNTKNAVSKINGQLDFEIKAKAGITASLNTSCKKLAQQQEKLEKMSKIFQEAAREAEKDNRTVKNKIDGVKAANVGKKGFTAIVGLGLTGATALGTSIATIPVAIGSVLKGLFPSLAASGGKTSAAPASAGGAGTGMGGVASAGAGGTVSNGKGVLLNIDTSALENQIGSQKSGTQYCKAYAMAYYKAVKDGKYDSYSKYWLSDKGLAAGSSAIGCTSKGISINSPQEYYQRAYDELNNGRPCIMYVTQSNGNQHWVLVTGYKDNVDKNNLSLDSFIFYDSIKRGGSNVVTDASKYYKGLQEGTDNFKGKNILVVSK